ncbi:MAG: glycosyltransferase family 4 protein [Patescibacteria group bacterium]
MNSKLNILITTGIYPPKIGGPAQYAKNLKEEFEKKGHRVSVKTFGIENILPTGVRHLWFAVKVIPQFLKSDVVFALDTFSVGAPSVFLGKVFGKKVIIRTGGDFLWEQYVERTSKPILLRNFYETEAGFLTYKEKIIYSITKWTLNNASRVVFSTEWQKQIFVPAYVMDISKTSIIENYYGPKEGVFETDSNLFVASVRDLKWKNINTLRKVAEKVSQAHSIHLLTENLTFLEFMKKIKLSRAVILVSLGDISPNMILDAIRYNKPFICTKEVGIYDRIKDAGTFVDPLNEDEIEKAILEFLDKEAYERAKERVKNFNFTHTWEEIAEEFIAITNSAQ